MKKNITLGLILAGVAVLSGCSASPESKEQDQLSAIVSKEENLTTPSRAAEINGVISSMEGNNIIVKNEVGKEILSEEEAAKKKAERQKMTQEERQALRAQEIANAKTEDVTLTVPVGITILKGTADGSGNSVKASYEDLKKGAYVSIWKQGGSIEVIKIKGL